MKNKYYFAVSYDQCSYEDFSCEMNSYPLKSEQLIDEELNQIARQDYAPLVKVFVSNDSDFTERSLYKVYTFSQYECHCNEEGKS